MRNRVFFPQAALDEWLASDRVDLRGDELTLRGENRRYRLVEAVHVLREVTGTADAFELVGRVKSKAYLFELEAEIVESSMLIGDNAYDVVPGFVGAPIGTFAEHVQASPSRAKSDEDLLASFVAAK